MPNPTTDLLPVVVTCSGGKPMGSLADQITRRLQAQGLVRMASFAGLSANILESSHAAVAPRVFVIDGCHSECAKRALEAVGLDDCECVDLIAAGVIEANVTPTEADVERGVAYMCQRIDAPSED